MLVRKVPVDEPFDARRTFRALGAGSFDGEGTWWWATSTLQGLATVAVERESGGVRARAWGPGAEDVLGRLPALVGSDDPFRPDGAVGPARELLTGARGLRLGATSDVHGSLVKTILEQVVTKPESKWSLRKLTAALGPEAPGPRPMWVVPGPSAIGSLSYEEFHAFGIERRRASILIECSRRSRRLAEILEMHRTDAYARLQAVRGIGPWTAAAVMGEAWGDRDAVMVGDYHLPDTVAWALAGEERGTDERMLELLEPYRPFRRHVMVALVQAAVHAPRYGPKTAPRSHL